MLLTGRLGTAGGGWLSPSSRGVSRVRIRGSELSDPRQVTWPLWPSIASRVTGRNCECPQGSGRIQEARDCDPRQVLGIAALSPFTDPSTHPTNIC